MKKRVLFLVLIAVLLIAMPASAKSKAIGEKISISLLDGVTEFTFDPDTPFHIAHGWTGLVPKNDKFKDYGFDLFIDDVYQDADHLKKTPVKVEKGVEITLHWIYNFPEGMPAGVYIFRGEWGTTCQIAVDNGWIPGPCAAPDEWVVFVNNVVGTFE